MTFYKSICTGLLGLAVVLAPTGVGAMGASSSNHSQASGNIQQGTENLSKVDDQWIVTTDPSAGPASQIAQHAAQRSRGSILAVYEYAFDGFAIKGGSKEGLSNLPGVVSVEPDLEVTTFAQILPTGVDRIEADTNETASIDGVDERVNADVAVIDTGVDLDHPDLNVFNGVDCTKGPSCSIGGDGNDDNGHGTHVAGTIGALDNTDGVVGVAPGARIWAVKVLRSDGSGFLSDVIEGIDYVTANADTIEVSNMSLGAQGQSSAMHTAIQNSVAAGVFYAVAAGNDDLDVYGPDGTYGTSDDIIPASYPEAAAVSALSDTDGAPGGNGPLSSWGGSDRDSDGVDDGEDDSFAFFSNFSETVVSNNPVSSPGAAVDLLLPGVDITSTWLDGGYHTISGTSMASPHGAGLAALYIAANGRDADGNNTINDDDVYAVRQALIDDGIDQSNSDGLIFQNDPDNDQERIGWAAGGAPTVNITDPNDGATVAGTTTVNVDASDPDGNIVQVEFFVDGMSVSTDTNGTDGWSMDWDTTAETEGSHTVTAEATDDDSKTSSDSISVVVDNNEAPTVMLTNPSDGDTVSDTITLTASSSDSDGNVSEVTFLVDGTVVGTDTNGTDGWSASWDSTAVGDGSHSVTAEAKDDDGERSSHAITITVDNLQEVSPVVESLNISEDNSGGSPHADFTVNWSVSDGDGDLDTVEFTLRDLDDGEVEDSTTIDVSGSSASGSESLLAKHEEDSGNTYEVELIVTDLNGNTVSATATEVEDGN